MKTPFILFFNEISNDDLHLVGGKGANLGELTRAGFKLPPGFPLETATVTVVPAISWRHHNF